jgi:drug/metabolite transporter (DMT)-like permease
VLLGAHFGTWIAAVAMTSIVRAVVLVCLQPIFAMLLGRLLGDRASTRAWVSTAIAVAGTGVMVTAEAGAGARASWIGDSLALVGAATAAGYLVMGRSVRDAVPLPGYLAAVNTVAAATLAGWLLVAGVDPWPADATSTDALAVLWLGLVPGLIGHGALNWAVRRVPVHVVSLAVLLEPIGAAALAWLWMGEEVGIREAIGGALLLGGVALGLTRSAPATVPAPQP